MIAARGRQAPRRHTVLVAHPGAELYGSDRMALESVAGFAEAGSRVVVALPGPGPLEPELVARGAEVVYLPVPVLRRSTLRPRGLLGLAARAVSSLGPCARLLRQVRPDTVYVSTLTIPTWIVLGRVFGAHTVCHVHEAERHSVPLVIRGLVTPLLLAHQVIANSSFTASLLTETLPSLRRRTSVVLNGVVGPDAASPPRTDVASGLQVLVPGRLSPRKGIDVAIMAASAAQPGGGVQLTVLGSVFPGYEWFEERLRCEAAEQLGNGQMTLMQFSSDVWPHLAAADVVVVPSVAPEGFGNVAVEALLAGRPVIVSDIGGLPEAVAGSRAALHVPAGDADALARALEDVARRWPELSSSAWADRERIVERFAPQRYRREVTADCIRGTRVGPSTDRSE